MSISVSEKESPCISLAGASHIHSTGNKGMLSSLNEKAGCRTAKLASMRAPTTSVLRKVAARSMICNHQRGRGGGMTQTAGWGCSSQSRVAGKGDVGSDMSEVRG